MRNSWSGQTEWNLLRERLSFAPWRQVALDHRRCKPTAGVAGNSHLSGRILVFRIVQNEFPIEKLVSWVLSQDIDLECSRCGLEAAETRIEKRS